MKHETKLSTFERAVLINQLEIKQMLSKLLKTSDAEHYEQAIEILRSGYEVFYDNALPGVYDPISRDELGIVFDTLDMYRAIEDYKSKHPDDAEIRDMHRATFQGFDGNNETVQMAFTRFVIETQGKWAEQKKYERSTDHWNSHAPMSARYSERVRRWKALGDDRFGLTRDHVLAILAD